MKEISGRNRNEDTEAQALQGSDNKELGKEQTTNSKTNQTETTNENDGKSLIKSTIDDVRLESEIKQRETAMLRAMTE